MMKMAAEKGENFPDLLNQTTNLLRKCYPPHLISVLASYALALPASAQGVETKSMMPGVEQYHIEFLQALAMTMPISEWGHIPALPADIQNAKDTLEELGTAFFLRRFKAIDGVENPQERVVLSLQERVRVHTQVVRNWAYFSDGVNISSELYAPLDEVFETQLGFRATDIIRVGEVMTRLVERRSTEHFMLLKRIFRETNIKRLVRTYFREMPGIKSDPEAFIAIIPAWATLRSVQQRLISHSDLRRPEIFTMSPEIVAEESSLPVGRVKSALSALSLIPSSLSAMGGEAILLNNPVWQRPVIELNDTFFCVMPQSIHSHIHAIIRFNIEKCDPKPQLDAIRANYLESKVARILTRAFPSGKIWHGTKWKSDEKVFETDHVVLIDRTIVIIEDKAAAITAPALRGAPDRVKRHIRDLISAPSEQSARLEQLIWQAKDKNPAAVASLSPFKFDYSNIDQVVRISVTLDDFSVLASSELLLKEAGWIPSDNSLATTVNVADFQCIVDMLEKTSFVVHYFSERSRVQKVLEILADEMDFLGFYLETGFNIFEIEARKYDLQLTGMSEKVDRYYESRDAGISIPKPRPRLTDYFARLIDEVENRAPDAWLTVNLSLLRSSSFDEQREIERTLLKVKSNVKHHWRDPSHECCLTITPPTIRDTAIVFYVFPDQLASMRHEKAIHFGERALIPGRITKSIVISRLLQKWDAPYASLFLITPSEAESSEKVLT